MERKPPSLAGPLWVIGIGLLILGMGVGFMAYVLWEKRAEAKRPAPQPPPTPEEVRQMVRSNRVTAMPSTRVIPPTRPAPASPTNASIPTPTPPAALEPESPPAGRSPDFSGFAGGVTAAGAGSVIFGRVTLRGTPPPEVAITVTDPNCGKAAPLPTQTRFYVVGKDGGLGDVFVYLHPASVVAASLRATGKRFQFAIPTEPVLVDQVGCEYQPHVLGIQRGQTLLVRNSDKTLHNNHFTPTVQGNQEVNRAHMPGGPDQPYVWPQPEVFLRLKCDVHPWMFSYIGVLDHPYFVVSAANGNFAILGVPPGRYVLEAVHRKTHGRGGNGLQREIEVKAGESLQLDFEIAAPAPR